VSRAPLAIRLLVVVLVVAGLLAALLGVWAWYQTGQIQELRRQVDSLEMARHVAENQAAELANGAWALEERLQAVEAQDTARQIEALRLQLEEEDDPEQVAELEARLAAVQSRVDGFQEALNDLAGRLQSLESHSAQAPPALPEGVRLQVPAQRQGHNLSCESSAASMAAHFQGVPLGEAEILAALPRHPNPQLGFRGNVDGPTGGLEDYGVYAGPVLEVLQQRGLQARLVEDGLAGVKAALARGNPVVAWITYNCQAGSPTTMTIDGEAVTLVNYQHAVVLTGYNDAGLWANDPWDGQEDFYAYPDLERAMGYLGDMAIEVGPPSP
jgi:uncharacterized protein YvpB